MLIIDEAKLLGCPWATDLFLNLHRRLGVEVVVAASGSVTTCAIPMFRLRTLITRPRKLPGAMSWISAVPAICDAGFDTPSPKLPFRRTRE